MSDIPLTAGECANVGTVDESSDALSYAPILWFCWPAIIAKRAGAHSGELLYVHSKTTPSAASRSIAGVIAGPPHGAMKGAAI